MANLNLTSIADGIKADRVEPSVRKARKALEYYSGVHLSDKQRASLCEDIADYIAMIGPQNVSVGTITNAMMEDPFNHL